MNNLLFICISYINNAAMLILMYMRKSKVDSVLFLIFDEVRRAAPPRTVADLPAKLRVEKTSCTHSSMFTSQGEKTLLLIKKTELKIKYFFEYDKFIRWQGLIRCLSLKYLVVYLEF